MEAEIKEILIQKLKEKGARKFNGFTIGLHANHIANSLLKKKGIKKDSAEYEAEHAKLKELIKKIHKDLPPQEVSKTPPLPSPEPAPAPAPAPEPEPEAPSKLKAVKAELKRLQKYLETSRPDELMSVAQEIQKQHKLYKELKEKKEEKKEKKVAKAEKKEKKVKEVSATKIQTAFKRSKQVKEAKGKLEELKKEFNKLTPEQEEILKYYKEQKATATKQKAFNLLKEIVATKRKEKIIAKIGQDEYDRLRFDSPGYSEYDVEQSSKKSVRDKRKKELDEIKEKYLKDYELTRTVRYEDSLTPKVLVYKKGKDIIQLRYYVGQNTWNIFYDDKVIHYTNDEDDKKKKEELDKRHADLMKKAEGLTDEAKKIFSEAIRSSDYNWLNRRVWVIMESIIDNNRNKATASEKIIAFDKRDRMTDKEKQEIKDKEEAEKKAKYEAERKREEEYRKKAEIENRKSYEEFMKKHPPVDEATRKKQQEEEAEKRSVKLGYKPILSDELDKLMKEWYSQDDDETFKEYYYPNGRLAFVKSINLTPDYTGNRRGFRFTVDMVGGKADTEVTYIDYKQYREKEDADYTVKVISNKNVNSIYPPLLSNSK
jgi:hypothetical protein